ncbi:glycosyltransferase [Nesterenkonia sandarakina]|uniref:Glycosyltransferase 2-like domain-containing protein n=1 Tax=Nesterenkonia sandarakina TaxID=272918 RepID=A0A2T0YAF1_9MICC|nr:glycosyltransferase family 2 protein [Nesterenkonia sandarakina]PRZ11656.1 hypothetical protein BCL67_1385 [Nesterenkonia sandarakina]
MASTGKRGLSSGEMSRVNLESWSLVTVTYNSAAMLREYWSNVRLPSEVEWIVVDNASADDSVEVARQLGARVISLTRNVGFGTANNIGFRSSESKFVGFLNPDVSPKLEDLIELEEVIISTAGIVAPQLTNPDGSLQPNGRGYPFLFDKVRNRLDPSGADSSYRIFASAKEDVPVVWFMGAVVLGTREQLENLGPWDERFFVYYEDSDLGLRAAAAGLPRTVTGRVRWVHGWARETSKLAVGPWVRELPSMVKFYSRYPRLLSLRPDSAKKKIASLGWPRP